MNPWFLKIIHCATTISKQPPFYKISNNTDKKVIHDRGKMGFAEDIQEIFSYFSKIHDYHGGMDEDYFEGLFKEKLLL